MTAPRLMQTIADSVNRLWEEHLLTCITERRTPENEVAVGRLLEEAKKEPTAHGRACAYQRILAVLALGYVGEQKQ